MKPRVLALVGCALVLLAAIWFATSDRRSERPPLTQSLSQATLGASTPGVSSGGQVPPVVEQGVTANRNQGSPAPSAMPATTPPSAAPLASPPVAPAPDQPSNTPPPSYVSPPLQGEAATASMELEKINLMLRDYRTLMGENPVGTNAEIMKAIMGGNPKGAMLGPPEGMSINGSGQLVDHWGTPYFFHQLSGTHMEIRSAGADKIMWTSDDVILK